MNATFVIQFIGLVAHVWLSAAGRLQNVNIPQAEANTVRAVVVAAKGHQQQLIVQCNDVVRLARPQPCPTGGAYTLVLGPEHYHLAGLPASLPEAGGDFSNNIMRLSLDVDKGAAAPKVKTDVLNGTGMAGVGTYIDYSGGAVSVDSTDPLGPAFFKDSKDPRPLCVPRGVRYVASIPETTTVMMVDDQGALFAEFSPSAKVVIQNDPVDCKNGQCEHWPAYAKLLAGSPALIAPTALLGSPCTTGMNRQATAAKPAPKTIPLDRRHLMMNFVTVECSNTQYP